MLSAARKVATRHLARQLVSKSGATRPILNKSLYQTRQYSNNDASATAEKVKYK